MRLRAGLWSILVATLCGPACARAGQGQLYADAARFRLRAHGHVAAHNSPGQIIQKFAAKETEFQDALNHYTYRRMARVQTMDDDNKVDGEYYEVDDVIFDPSGKRTEKVVFAPASTLQRVMMSPSDLQDIQHGYPFVLTSRGREQIQHQIRGQAEGG